MGIMKDIDIRFQNIEETMYEQYELIHDLLKKCSESEQKIEKLEKKLKQVEHTADWAYHGLGLK